MTMKTACIIAALAILTTLYSRAELTTVNPAARGKSTGLFRQPEPAYTPVDFLRGRLDFSIFVLPNLAIGGAGSYLGSAMQLFDETTWQVDLPNDVLFDTRTDYSDRTVPIITNPEADIPFYLNLGYTYENTRIGLSWTRMAASWEQSGELPGLDFYSDDQAEGFGFGFVSFWNMGWDLHVSRNFPASWVEGFRDRDDPDQAQYDLEFFPDRGLTAWATSHDISFNSFQFSLQHPLVTNEIVSLSLVGGLQYGRWSDNLMQLLEITAHTELTDRWTQLIPVNNEEEADSILVEVYSDFIFHNEITLETNSSSSFNSLGLLAGIEATWRMLPSLSFSLRAGGSTLSGNATFSGTGIDIDDIVESDILTLYDMEGNLIFYDPLEGYEFLSGQFNLPEHTSSVLSSNYYMNISARYNLTNAVSLMAGYYYSIWQNLPMSPRWSYSDRFTRPYGAFAVEESWDKQRSSNISASGFQFGIGLRF
jgi:hypothetical protein